MRDRVSISRKAFLNTLRISWNLCARKEKNERNKFPFTIHTSYLSVYFCQVYIIIICLVDNVSRNLFYS